MPLVKVTVSAVMSLECRVNCGFYEFSRTCIFGA